MSLPQISSNSLVTAAVAESDVPSIRPRKGRLTAASGGLASSSPWSSRDPSPIPAGRIGHRTATPNKTSYGGGLFESKLSLGWASVQDFASTLLAGSGEGATGLDRSQPASRSTSRHRPSAARRQIAGVADAWGPEPPANARPRLQDVAAGTLTQRESRLKALRTASVLQSHDGVNGGLDVAGKFKKRSSDEDLRATADEVEDYLVYIHHVKPSDTYAGIVLRYRCQEDAFRKANGLWSRDNIQVRKRLYLPVDACEVKGRPCDSPTSSPKLDLLAPTPEAQHEPAWPAPTNGSEFPTHDANGKAPLQAVNDEEEKPWTHVKWVTIDSIPDPVEIGRVSRKTLGYFPPRRKRSIQTNTNTALSTPRGSLDVPSITLGSEAALDSPPIASSPRQSSSMSRSVGDDGAKPAWMRRPGGVGSLGRHVRTPGPEKDYLNSWTRKHLPGLNIETLPSMSVMGSETARFGFGSAPAGGGDLAENPGIAESSFADGRDTESVGRGDLGPPTGSGLEKAAAAVEMWLRNAWAKHPTTPVLGPRGGGPRYPGLIGKDGPEERGDLIELEDANGGHTYGDLYGPSDLPSHGPYGSSARSEPVARGRGTGSKGKKSD